MIKPNFRSASVGIRPPEHNDRAALRVEEDSLVSASAAGWQWQEKTGLITVMR